jgi:hypothetical protein
MCVVSAVGDYWKDDFNKRYPNWPERTDPFAPNAFPTSKNLPIDLSKFATKEDIENIKKDLLELKELLKAAIKYDEKTNQPHCENDEKIALIKQVAKAVNVDLSDLNLN